MSTLNWQQRWDPFRDFQREVGRLFESMEPVQHWRVTRGVPPINLYDSGETYVLTALLPGIGPEEVDLSITGETLTIRGDRKGFPTRVFAARNVSLVGGPARSRSPIASTVRM
jgi:HSP20 family protein